MPAMEENSKGEVFLKIAKVSVYLLVFLLPLFFLSFTQNVLDFQKQALLFLLVLVSFLSFLTYVLISKKLEINFSFLNIPVLILLLATWLSTFFSLSRYGSFWGQPLSISASFLTLLLLAILYFIIANVFKKEDIPFLLLLLFISGFLAALFFVTQLFSKFLLPFDFARVISFNTIGSVNSSAVYFAILLILLLPLLFSVKRIFKVVFGISGLTLLLALFLANFQTAWLVLAVGTACLLAFSVVSPARTISVKLVVLLAVFLIASLFFSFFRFSMPGQLPTAPLEISPNHQASFDVVKKLSAKSLILGSGPGTFVYEWTTKKPQAINETIFWGIRFSQPSSEVLDRIAATGILGILAFFFLLGACFKLVFTAILKRGDAKDLSKSLLWGIFAAFAALTLSFFLYTTNLSILFLLWLLVGFSSLLIQEKKKVWDLGGSQRAALAASFSFVFILVLGVGATILYAQKYWAEVNYLQGLLAWQRGDLEQSSNRFSRATDLNPKADFYWRDLSQMRIFQLQQLLAQSGLTQDEVRARAEVLIASAVNSSGRATEVDPNNVANWNIRGFVYKNMIGVLGGADNWALNSYQKALELDPLSPFIQTEIGRTYLLLADLLAGQEARAKERAESLQKARESFEKAISLKADYAPAHFQSAMIHIREGRIKEAAAKLEETKLVAPFDTGLAFQLGLVYYNDGQFDSAKREFERAVVIDPNYSNAHYFLGLVYEREGKGGEAISQFEKVAELNPDNEEVKKIVDNLRQGKRALEGIVPGQPPIEEKPKEQLEK